MRNNFWKNYIHYSNIAFCALANCFDSVLLPIYSYHSFNYCEMSLLSVLKGESEKERKTYRYYKKDRQKFKIDNFTRSNGDKFYIVFAILENITALKYLAFWVHQYYFSTHKLHTWNFFAKCKVINFHIWLDYHI